jgi:hypothetical protein
MAGGLIGMNLERGRQAQGTLLNLASQEQAMNAANEQIKAAERAEKGALVGTGAGVGAKLGIEAGRQAATAAAPSTVSGFFAPSGGAAALTQGANAATAATTAATAAEGATAATAASSGAAGGASGALAAAPWVLGGMAVAYLLSELFD